jgi:arabinose-5-phosphate isomerase
MTVLPLRESTSFSNPDLAEGARVLSLESKALETLAKSLDATFVKALDLLEKTSGRIIVSGMGKSGHIGKKIAATLASTGTPSLFVHPAEASHGDLGMLTKGDTLLALSVSGETNELCDILTYASREEMPLIAITFGNESTLANTAQVALVLPSAPEACPLGMAPTTSSTMMLALGDALAVCLLKRRGFSCEDFGSLHPGGKLGQRLLKVEKIMHTGNQIPLLHEDACMQNVIVMISEKSLGCVGVINEQGALVGVITDGDLRRHMNADLLKQRACDVMTRAPKTIPGHMLVAEAVTFLTKKGITNVFVTRSQDGQEFPVGVLHVHACLRAGFA